MSSLRNLPEDSLYSFVPPAVADLDVRSLVQAVMGGMQDALADLRSYAGRYEELINPNPPAYTCVQVTFQGDAGTPITIPIDTTPSTPDNPDLLPAWAAEQLDIEPSRVIQAVLGTDALRLVGVDTVESLAQSLGAVLYPGLPGESPASVLERRRQTMATYFPRLRMKGTVKSFSAFARLAGFSDGSMIPLWTRLSPRIPANVGDPRDDPDFAAVPDIYPSGRLPDPTGLYDPTDFTGGPFFRWNSGTVDAEPTSLDYIIPKVNGFSPFINLSATGLVKLPLPGVYEFAGGAPGRIATAILSSGTDISNVVARALTDGDSFNGMRLVVTGTGSYRDLEVTEQLSTVQYRSSYFDLALYRVNAGTQAISVNEDLAADPQLDPDGTAVAPFRPWSEGAQLTQNVTLWPVRQVTTSGTAIPRIQAIGTTIEIDLDALTGDAQRVYDLSNEVRAATRRPRRSSVGLMSQDDILVAAYPCDARILSPSAPGSYSGTVSADNHPLVDYEASFSILYPPTAPNDLTIQRIDSGTVSFAGVGITGVYAKESGKWTATLTSTMAGTLYGIWSDPSADVIRPEPTNAAKMSGTICFTQQPEGTLLAPDWDLVTYDDVPWLRPIRENGEALNVNFFEPCFGDPQPIEALTQTARAYDTSGVANRLTVYDLIGIDQPPYLKAATEVETTPITRMMAGTMIGTGTHLFPVVVVSPTTVVSEATWAPGRYEDALLWYPLAEHPAQALRPVQALGLAPSQVYIRPEDRQWDSTRGWALAISAGGTVANPDVGLPDQYGFALNLKLTGANSGTVAGDPWISDVAVEVGAARIRVRPSSLVLSVNNGLGYTEAALPFPPGTNTLVYVNVGTSSAEMGFGSMTSWGTHVSIPVVAPHGVGVALMGGHTAVQAQDFMVWGSMRSQAQLDSLRNPTLTHQAVPNPRPYVEGITTDRWSLNLMPSHILAVPVGALARPLPYPQGDEQRYEGTGRYNGNPAYKQVGLGGADNLPASYRLGVQGLSIQAEGRSVAIGTYAEPGWNVPFTGSIGTVYTVSPPYGPTGGATTSRTVSTTAGWPAPLERYNAATDRVYIKGDDQLAYQVSLDDIGAGVFLTATLTERPDGRDIVTDFETVLATTISILSVTGTPVVYQKSQASAVATTPLFLYLNSRVKAGAPNAFTRWVNPNPFGNGINTAALDTVGSLIFENAESLPAGNYRLTVNVGNIGTVDDQFHGFDNTVVITTGVGEPIQFPAILLPDGTGTNPTGTTKVEFTIPYVVTGAWRLAFNWTNDRDVPSRGQFRRMAIFSYDLRRIASELHTVTLDPLTINLVDVNAIPPLKGGAYVAQYNSYGTIVSYAHEQALYGHTLGLDTFNDPRSPLADTITGSTTSKRDYLSVNNPWVLPDDAVPSAPSAGTLVVVPSLGFYNEGDTVLLKAINATGEKLRYTFHLWGVGTISNYSGTLTDVNIDRGGFLPVDVMAIDDLGRFATASLTLPVNYSPVIQAATASLTSAPVPYNTNLSAIVSDADNDPFTVSWFRGAVMVGTGTFVPDYIVTETQEVSVVATDSRGGTSTALVPLTGGVNSAPTVSIVAIVPEKPKVTAIEQTLQLAAVARDPENRGVSTSWEFWDGLVVAGHTQRMTFFGGGTYCTVERPVINETEGVREFTLTVTDTDGNVTIAPGQVDFVVNQTPIIYEVTVSEPGVAAGTVIRYAARAADPDGDPLDYTWNFPALNLILLGANVNIDTSGLAGRSIGGSLTVSDPFGGSATQIVPSVSVSDGGLAPVVISPAGGISSIGLVVTITSPDSGVTIRYTMDGSDPTTIEMGDQYQTGGVMVPYVTGATIPFKARAFLTASAPSPLASVTFVFT